jgi:hypothetical protein
MKRLKKETPGGGNEERKEEELKQERIEDRRKLLNAMQAERIAVNREIDELQQAENRILDELTDCIKCD